MRRIALELVSGPEIEPVTLAEAKRHLGEFDDVTDNDDDIEALIVGAREWVEDYTSRALIDQTWRLTIGDSSVVDAVGAPACTCARSESTGTEIFLRRSPIIAITSFAQVAADGTETVLDPAGYELREAGSKWPRVVAIDGSSWISGQYRITFRAGYANRDVSPADSAEVVPNRFKQAMKLWIEANYDRGDMMKTLLDTATSLIRAERADLGLA